MQRANGPALPTLSLGRARWDLGISSSSTSAIGTHPPIVNSFIYHTYKIVHNPQVLSKCLKHCNARRSSMSSSTWMVRCNLTRSV